MSGSQHVRTVVLSSQPVELYKILKFEGIAESGAQAKRVIDDGQVCVNGEVETRRRKKILHGDVIVTNGIRLDIVFQDAVA